MFGLYACQMELLKRLKCCSRFSTEGLCGGK